MYRASSIKSIQRGTISILAASLTGTATITSVDTNYSYVEYSGNSGDTGTNEGSTVNISTVRLVMTNATTITATRGTVSATSNLTVPYQVIEFYPRVLRSTIQRGTITMATGDAAKSATISSVTTSKVLLPWGGATETSGASGGDTMGKFHPYVTLADATTVTVTRTTSGTYSWVIPYQVVEFR